MNPTDEELTEHMAAELRRVADLLERDGLAVEDMSCTFTAGEPMGISLTFQDPGRGTRTVEIWT